MLIVRLKQCETALADGRLDEAFELARRPDVRAHRRGQALIGRLLEAFVERGRGHLAAGQLIPAGHDCEKAAELGGNQTDVAQLRTAIGNALTEQRRTAQLRDQVFAAARRHAEVGQLTLGERLIAESPVADNRAELLKQDLAAKRAALQAAVERAAAALKSDDWESAIDHLSRLDRACRSEPAARELCRRIDELVVGQATDEIESGRLNRAEALLARLARMPGQSVDAEHLRRTLAQCRDAFDRLNRADHAGAEQMIRALASQWPKARWLSEVRDQLRTIRQTSEELRTGPLGIGANHDHVAVPVLPVASIPVRERDGSASPINCILHVDGVGGFRVIDRSAITIGPVSSSRPVDLPLMADAGLPTITITRSDDDYFLQSARPVLVNDKPVTGKLLAHGDRIGLGPRCRITFRRPSPASSSAVLDLSGTRLPQGDVRHVILMDRELIVGPGASAHIRSDDLASPAVIHRRDGRLVCRADGSSTELAPGIHVSLGSVGLVVAREGAGA